MNYPKTSRLTALLGTASLLAIAQAEGTYAAEVVAQAEEIPETVLITGSLIRGTAVVGVPVVNLGPMDFAQTGAISVADLFRSIPEFNVNVGGGVGTVAAGRAQGGTRVNLRQLDTGTAPRNLMMIDGMRFPPQDQGLCQIEPDIIPVAAIERIDLLLDGASATYGSDAIGGVFNLILRRAFDGAITQVGYRRGAGGNNRYFASQLWGRTWDGGNITLSYEWRDTAPTKGTINSRYSFDFSPFGLDDRTPLASSMPGTISTGGTTSYDQTNYPSAQGRNCLNCYAIPAGTGSPFDPGPGGVGPTAPSSAATLNWAVFSTNPAYHNPGSGLGAVDLAGTQNGFNPYYIVDYSAAIQYNGAALTVDQRLTRNISFYGEAFYGMRRAQVYNQANGNQLSFFSVPTFNPYYPTNAPTNLRVAYHMSFESPSRSAGNELAQRYQGGLNVALPYGWAGQISYSMTRDANWVRTTGTVNKAAVSAALGWTMPASPGVGTKPTIAAFTKPANVPYLNLFCDARSIVCNSDMTLAYIGNFARSDEAYWVNQKTIKADGPLFDLPGGTVKAAIGADYISNHFIVTTTQQDQNNTTINLQSDPQSRQVWATYAQLNIPVFSDQNGFFGMRRLDFEASWRHDQYSDFGGTSNQKVGFNWAPIEDFMIRGTWGTSFRAPNFGENSAIVNSAWNAFGLPTNIFQNNTSIAIQCTNGLPVAGSGSEKLFNAGFACDSRPAGMSFNGGAKSPNLAGWREYRNQAGQVLQPEVSTNWNVGFDYTPSNNFLTGLNLSATYYLIKITGVLVGFGNPTSSRFSDAALGFAYIVPSDLRDGSGTQLCPGMDASPWLCPEFQSMIQRAISQPNNSVPAIAQTLIYWLNDGGTQNTGWLRISGIDYQASYDFDAGNLGAFNVGITGAYYLHNETVRVPGAPGEAGQPVDSLHDNLPANGGVEQLGVIQPRARHKYRARLGWSAGAWNTTLFMNYTGHFYHTQGAPPNVNFQCLTQGGTVGAAGNPNATYPCLIDNYNNIQPSYYTFDLSIGYDTGDQPANEYLRNISIQLTVDNIMDRTPAFQYRISTGGGNPSAFDISKDIYGRMIGVRLTKNW